MPFTSGNALFVILFIVQVGLSAYFVWDAEEGRTEGWTTIRAIWTGLESYVVVSGAVSWILAEVSVIIAEAFKKEWHAKLRAQGRAQEREKFEEALRELASRFEVDIDRLLADARAIVDSRRDES